MREATIEGRRPDLSPPTIVIAAPYKGSQVTMVTRELWSLQPANYACAATAGT